VTLEVAARLGGHVECLPVHVLAASERELQHAGGHGGVGQPVNQDEAAHVAVGLVGVERDGAVGGDRAHANLVEPECFGGQVLERVDVDRVFRGRQGGAHRGGAELE
jgi:hypothetical protein